MDNISLMNSPDEKKALFDEYVTGLLEVIAAGASIDSPEVKARMRAYSQKPEVKARRKAYYKKNRIKILERMKKKFQSAQKCGNKTK